MLMDRIVINGGKRLNGTVSISGMKNAALPIVFSSIVTGAECIIENIPPVNDVLMALEIIREMGAEVEFTDIFQTTVRINSANIKPCSAPDDMVAKIRGSIYLAGAELGRFGHSSVALPGGCNFGKRPIDQHEKAFRTLGADVVSDDKRITCSAPEGLRGATVYFDIVSVGATINAMIAAVRAEGVTVLEGAAREPHIVDVANFLNTCGANISGAGTDTIKIRGVRELHGCDCYTIIPDMIEAGTYMAAVAATGGCVRVENIIPKHMDIISSKLSEMGAFIEEDDDAITVTVNKRLRAVNIKTAPYPGFPTDMHPQFSALFTTCDGVSEMNETVFEQRFRYVDELRKMGAVININGKTARIAGVNRLSGATVKAVDLRAGAAMIIAGLAAEGETVITDVESIQRGYANIVNNFRALGADIEDIGYAVHIFNED